VTNGPLDGAVRYAVTVRPRLRRRRRRRRVLNEAENKQRTWQSKRLAMERYE